MTLKDYITRLRDRKPSGSDDEMWNSPVIVFSGFLEIKLRWYPPYEGRNPVSGKIIPVPGKYMLAISATQDFISLLNGEISEPLPITLDDGRLDKKIQKKFIGEANRCRQELISGGRAKFGEIADLRVAAKSTGPNSSRRMLTTRLGDDEENSVRSPLLTAFEEFLNTPA